MNSGLLRVFVVVDPFAHVVGFMVELVLILLGEMAVVSSHITFFVVLQALLAVLQAGGLSRLQLSVLNSVGDPILLIGFASVDLIHARMAGVDLARTGAGRVALRLSSSGCD